MRVQATEDTFGFATGLLDQLIASRTARVANSRGRATFDGASTWHSETAFENAKAPRLTPALFARINLRYPDICDRVLALHARGYGLADIQSRVSMYTGEQIPAAFFKAALADLETEAGEWSRRPLEPNYPIVVFERMRVRWRDRTGTQNRNCHFAIGFHQQGPKEVLGFWLEKSDEWDLWTEALGDLRDRGVDDIIYFVGSGNGALQALARAFPATSAIPHVGNLVRQSQDLSTCKNRCTIAKALRPVHAAASQAEAATNLELFEASELGRRNPSIVSIWKRHWSDLEPFFAIPTEVRCVMTSTFAADGLRRGLKHALARRKQISSSSETATLMYLVARDARRNWKRPQREWHAAKGQLALQFPDRFF